MFLHGSLLHLGGNMLFLWIFGNNIEDSMGRLVFVVFYVLGGLAALGLQVAMDPDSVIPTVGASGAIAAVLGAYARLYPRARVVTLIIIIIFFTVVTLPALLVLGLWFLLQLLPAFSEPVGSAGGGVAYFAHIGGFLFGAPRDQAVREQRARGLRPGAPYPCVLMGRTLALVGSLVIICLLAFLTISVAVERGIDVLVVLSVIILALLGFGVLGALTSPPPDG